MSSSEEVDPIKDHKAAPAIDASATTPGHWQLYLLAFILIALVAVRSTGHLFDHALANIATVLLLLLGWILLAFTLRKRKLVTSWRAVVFLPLLSLLVFCCLFRFERLDAELIPQFSPRWKAAPELPESAAQTPNEQDKTFASRETDFPQFLGPNRDAKLNAKIDPNWKDNPPKIAWKQPIGEGWAGFAIQGDAAITLEQRGKEEWVSAYSLTNGTLLWNYATEGLHTDIAGGTGPRSTPTIYNNRVYATLAVSKVVCLDLLSGEKIWEHSLLELGRCQPRRLRTRSYVGPIRFSLDLAKSLDRSFRRRRRLLLNHSLPSIQSQARSNGAVEKAKSPTPRQSLPRWLASNRSFSSHKTKPQVMCRRLANSFGKQSGAGKQMETLRSHIQCKLMKSGSCWPKATASVRN